MVYLLFSMNRNVMAHYAYISENDIAYLGYTKDVSVAEDYAAQFEKKQHQRVVWYTKVSEEYMAWFNNTHVKKDLDRGLPEITRIVSGDGKVEICLSDLDIEYLDEICSEAADEYIDLQYAIENLERYRSKRAKRIVRMLNKFLIDMEEGDTAFQDEMEFLDIAYHYRFLAERIGIFNDPKPF